MRIHCPLQLPRPGQWLLCAQSCVACAAGLSKVQCGCESVTCWASPSTSRSSVPAVVAPSSDLKS